MSKNSQATIAVTIQGDGMNLVDSDTVLNDAAHSPTTAALSAGNNTVTVPSGVNGVKIKNANPGSAFPTVTLKGITGDTGITVDLTNGPVYLTLPNTATSIILGSSGSGTVLLEWS